MIAKLDGLAKYTHWLVRLSLAATFLYHGAEKFGGAEGFANSMGMPLVAAYVLAALEVAGGLLVVYGGIGPDWATRVAGLIFAALMMGAIVQVHAPQWSFLASSDKPAGGMEFQTLIVMISLYLVTHGKKVNA